MKICVVGISPCACTVDVRCERRGAAARVRRVRRNVVRSAAEPRATTVFVHTFLRREPTWIRGRNAPCALCTSIVA